MTKPEGETLPVFCCQWVCLLGGQMAACVQKNEDFCGFVKMCIDFLSVSSYHKDAMILYNTRDYARLYFDRTYNR